MIEWGERMFCRLWSGNHAGIQFIVPGLSPVIVRISFASKSHKWVNNNIINVSLVPVPANGDGNNSTEGGGTQPQEDGGRGGDGGDGEDGQGGDGEGQGGEAYGDNGGGEEDEGGVDNGGQGEEGQGDGEEQGGEDYRDNGEGGGGGDEDHYDENDSDEDDENNDEEEDDTTDSDDEHMEEGEDEMEADIGGATAAPPQPQDMNYDASLPGAHAVSSFFILLKD